MKIPLSSIERDEGLQVRSKGTSRELVREYVEARRRGVVLPPVDLFVDEQGRYWIGDGWHRILAEDSLALSRAEPGAQPMADGKSQMAEGVACIEANVQPGGRRAAFLHALKANDAHGARRTRQDKLNAIKLALADPEIRQQSDREIARMCNVDHKTVGKVRAGESSGALFDVARKGRDGKVRRSRKQVGISPVGENMAPDSALGGAGGGRGENDEGQMADGRANTAGAFNVVREMHELETQLGAEFSSWPEEKRHAFCVALANFAKLNDPEIRERTEDALDEMLKEKGEKRG